MSDEPKVIGYGVRYADYVVRFDTEEAAELFAQERGNFVAEIIRLVTPKDLAAWVDGKRKKP